LNHPLSAAHSSVAFFQQAKEVGLPQGCRSCHAAGKGLDPAKCTTCHGEFAGGGQHAALSGSTPRALSEIPTKPGAAPVSPVGTLADAHGAGGQLAGGVPGGCVACHGEHKGAARWTGLGANESCKRGGCHPSAHDDAIFESKTAAPVVVKAPALTTLDLSQEELHLVHAKVPKRCIACHGTADGKEANAKLSCFRCHVGGQTLAVEQCRSCHVEHKGAHLARSVDPALRALSPAAVVPARSFLSGTALALLAFVPLTVVSVVYRARRGRRDRALVQEVQAAPTESVKRLVHSINMAKCVGCSMCVSACPASVLELIDHKSRVVNFDACIQCKKCEVACNFDALRMHDADKSPPTVEVPDLDAYYQTTVPGLYLIGQASGVPLVKNANNLGRAVVEHALDHGLSPGLARSRGADVEVIIVGSGPAGLSAALTCAKEGLSYVCLEKGREFSTTIRTYYHKGKQLLAEPPETEAVGYLPVWDTDREQILARWQEVVTRERLCIECESAVTDVRKDGDLFVVKTVDLKGQDKRTWRGTRVVLAIGSMGSPRRLGCTGDDRANVYHSLVDQDAFDGKQLLVVGGGDAAVEVALALGAAHRGSNRVHLSYRRDKFDRIKPRNRARLDQAMASGRVTVLFSSTVQEVKEHSVLVKLGDGAIHELPNDAVFCLLGGDPPMKWLQSIGVRYVHKPHSWSPERTDELVQLRLLKR
jgi:thioredoxin reductase/formate hydrogenlyase subunit 6/NADH:ubiquinone oxidoreductase subunit I